MAEEVDVLCYHGTPMKYITIMIDNLRNMQNTVNARNFGREVDDLIKANDEFLEGSIASPYGL